MEHVEYERTLRRLSKLAERLDEVTVKLKRAVSRMRLSDGSITPHLTADPYDNVDHIDALASDILDRDARMNVANPDKMQYHQYIEMMDIEEWKKFRGMPPINEAERTLIDFDNLIERLQQES